jgi:hypothetical protein
MISAQVPLGEGTKSIERTGQMADSKKHKVEFKALRTVREEVPVKFKTRAGDRVSFEATKKVKEPVRVKFLAKDK